MRRDRVNPFPHELPLVRPVRYQPPLTRTPAKRLHLSRRYAIIFRRGRVVTLQEGRLPPGHQSKGADRAGHRRQLLARLERPKTSLPSRDYPRQGPRTDPHRKSPAVRCRRADDDDLRSHAARTDRAHGKRKGDSPLACFVKGSAVGVTRCLFGATCAISRSEYNSTCLTRSALEISRQDLSKSVFSFSTLCMTFPTGVGLSACCYV